jgi:DNA-binding transcriptional regulator LsrR (DeoR family)
MAKKTSDSEASRLDEAARAGWLYYIAGNTQDEIAVKLGVSRQTAQRLVSLAVSQRLIKVSAAAEAAIAARTHAPERARSMRLMVSSHPALILSVC